MSREYIASVLKRLRAEQGMTADEVGEIIGKSWKDRMSGWESARSRYLRCRFTSKSCVKSIRLKIS